MADLPTYGVVVGDKMYPIDTRDHEAASTVAARQALLQAGKRWARVWRFPTALTEPSPIGATGPRKGVGRFFAHPFDEDPVVAFDPPAR